MTEETKTKSSAYSQTSVGLLSQFITTKKPDAKAAKRFFRKSLELTGTEVSLTTYPAGFASPGLHIHYQNEELYIFISGSGQMQLDDELIDVCEGDFVRVAPETARGIKAGSETDLVFLCIQSKENSLEQCNSKDGEGAANKLLI